MSRTILVTGGRGKTGREVVRQLRGHADVIVRSGSTNAQAAEDGNTRPVKFDWHEPATWVDAFTGADAIFLMRPDVPDADALIANLLDLNTQAHVILLSEQGAEQLPHSHWVSRVEAAVTGKAKHWTVLRPSWFMQNFTDPRFYLTSIKDGHLLAMPSAGAPIAWVDTRDVAAVAVAVLGDASSHSGAKYTLTGPNGVTIAAIARLLSIATGKEIASADPAIEDAIQDLDAFMTAILGDLYRRVQDGGFAPTTKAVENITGKSARGIEAFIEEHREVWRG